MADQANIHPVLRRSSMITSPSHPHPISTETYSAAVQLIVQGPLPQALEPLRVARQPDGSTSFVEAQAVYDSLLVLESRMAAGDFAVAKWDWDCKGREGYMPLTEGIMILDRTGGDWWKGRVGSNEG